MLKNVLSRRLKMISIIFFTLLCFNVSQARADEIYPLVNSICSSTGEYFELRTFVLTRSTQFDYGSIAKNQSAGQIFFQTLKSLVGHPIKCEIRDDSGGGYIHAVKVTFSNYYDGSNAQCAGGPNGTIQVTFDGQIFATEDNVYGGCSPQRTLLEFTGHTITFCILPDFNYPSEISGASENSDAYSRNYQISANCKSIDIFRFDVSGR